MSAEIISFRSARDLMRCDLVPSGRLARQRSLERQIARIEGLLEEIEELAGASDSVRSTVDRARWLLRNARLDDALNGGDPQPEVDRALLERLYRELKP